MFALICVFELPVQPNCNLFLMLDDLLWKSEFKFFFFLVVFFFWKSQPLTDFLLTRNLADLKSHVQVCHLVVIYNAI